MIVVCDEGYSSTLAAHSLRCLGLDATDLEGGFQAVRSITGRGDVVADTFEHAVDAASRVRLTYRAEQAMTDFEEAKLRQVDPKKATEPSYVLTSGDALKNIRRFIGSDKSPGSVADDTKRLLREHFRGKGK